MVEIKRILFPIDFTGNSSKILPYVLSLSGKYDAGIYLLHVIEKYPVWEGGVYLPSIPWEQFQKDAVKAATKKLDEVCEEQLKGCNDLQKMVLTGDPAQEILNVIGPENIDLVIMGTHGRKGLEHVLFGSVAEVVVKKSQVPVLTINPYKIKNS